jgi:hypothetical protein
MNEGKLIRGFIWTNKAWYAKDIGCENDRVNFGVYLAEGGIAGEMRMEWIPLAGKIVPRLNVFPGSWKSLASFKDVLDALALVSGENITDAEFVKILLDCGFTDLTRYTSPPEDLNSHYKATQESAAVNEEDMMFRPAKKG